MANFRFLDPNPIHWNNDGTVCAGGELRFYTTLTTTPTNAGEGPDLSPSLGATVTLDSSGRAEDDIWLPGVTRVRLYDADGALQWDRDYVQDAAVGGITPLDPADGTEDQVYSTDGVDALWRTILEVPDPSGNSGKYVGTDGTSIAWTAFPAAVTYSETALPDGITQSGSDLQIGKYKIQNGSGVAPTASAAYTSVAVTFAEAYASAPLFIGIEPNTDNVTPAGALVSFAVTSRSTTGFTVKFYAGQEHGASDWFITSAVNFKYSAHGIVA